MDWLQRIQSGDRTCRDTADTIEGIVNTLYCVMGETPVVKRLAELVPRLRQAADNISTGIGQCLREDIESNDRQLSMMLVASVDGVMRASPNMANEVKEHLAKLADTVKGSHGND